MKKKREEEERKEKERLKKKEQREKEQREEGQREEAHEDPEGFCCFHAKVRGDFCGSCHPMGKALPESYCAKSRSHCEACGGTGRGCDLGGGDADDNGSGVWTSSSVIGRSEWRRLPRASEGGRGAAVLLASAALAALLAASALFAARRAG